MHKEQSSSPPRNPGRDDPAGRLYPVVGSMQDRSHYFFEWVSAHCSWDARHRRIYTSLHLSIQDEKVYVHSDPTEEGIANVLIEKGILQSDIVLEYQAPELRQYTPFAKV